MTKKEILNWHHEQIAIKRKRLRDGKFEDFGHITQLYAEIDGHILKISSIKARGNG